MTPTPGRLNASLPYGVRDLVYGEASRLLDLGDAWRSLFGRWGYGPVVTPTYEHYDVLLHGYGADQESDLYRVLDREGAVLALRPDITTQVARLAGAKLAGEPRPLRFCYFTNVFRYDEPQAGRQREFFQAGVELIGAGSAQADAEVLELCVESLLLAGLRDFQVNLGHMGVFRGIVSGLGLRPGQVAGLRRAIDRKDGAGLLRLLREDALPPPVANLLQALPRLCGGPEVLDELAEAMPGPDNVRGSGEHSAGEPAMLALDNLRAIYALLQAHGVAEHVVLDLGEVRGMGYYTGINFEGFVAGIGSPICSGGRYDNLVGLYGPPSPAVGFALGVERVLMAQDRQGGAPHPTGPDLLVSIEAAEKGRAAISAARALGWRVAADPLPRSRDEVLDYARQRGISRVLLDGGATALLVDSGRQRAVAWPDLVEAIRTWLI